MFALWTVRLFSQMKFIMHTFFAIYHFTIKKKMCKNLLLEIEWDTILSSSTGEKMLILILRIDGIQSFKAMYHTLRNHNNSIFFLETEIQVLQNLNFPLLRI